MIERLLLAALLLLAQGAGTPPQAKEVRDYLNQPEWYGVVTVAIRGGGTIDPNGKGTFSVQRQTELKFRIVSLPEQVSAREAARKILENTTISLDPKARKQLEDVANSCHWFPDVKKPDGVITSSVQDSYTSAGGTVTKFDGEGTAENLVLGAQILIDALKKTYTLKLNWSNKIDIKETRPGSMTPPTTSPGMATPSLFNLENQPIPALDTPLKGILPVDPKLFKQFVKAADLSGVQATIEWTLVPKALPPMDLVVEIDAYQDWLPVPSLDGDGFGNKLTVAAVLKGQGGAATADSMERATFELADVSREPGISGNAPPDPALDLMGDLALRPEDNIGLKCTGLAQAFAMAKDCGTRVQAVIAARDGGAYGILKVRAFLKSGRILDGALSGRPLLREIPIPRRTLPSRIGDLFKEHRGVYSADDADDETDPPGDTKVPGDGLTFYEEYRGFHENGNFIRGDPKKKDFFVCTLDKDPRIKDGIAMFETATGLKVHGLLKKEELKDRVINANKATVRIGDQHGVIIEGFRDTVAYGGKDQPISRLAVAYGPGMNNPKTTPKDYTGIAIATNLKGETARSVTRGGVAVAGPDPITHGVAHELCHTVNLSHHGDQDNGVQKQWDVQGTLPGGPFTVTEGGQPITVVTEQGTPYAFKVLGPGEVRVGLNGGVYSGDVNCLMRYYFAHAYTDPKNPSARIWVSDDDLPGTALCKSKAGTGINGSRTPARGGPRFGSATNGNCSGQIIVRDK